MELITNIEEFRKKREAYNFVRRVGYVSTGGAIHEGHLSLIREMVKESDFRIVSIFVNPTEFKSNDDYMSYPRNLERDIELLKSTNIDVVFAPSAEELYPLGVTDNFKFKIPKPLSHHLCGQYRAGYFDGACQHLVKMLNLVKPDVTYFGQKDYQLARIAQAMVKDLFLGSEIRVLPTVRTKKGIALSARNKMLQKEQAESAEALIRTLEFLARVVNNGEENVVELKKMALEFLESYPEFKLEYLEMVDAVTMEPLGDLADAQNILAATAGYVGDVRLIDNVII